MNIFLHICERCWLIGVLPSLVVAHEADEIFIPEAGVQLGIDRALEKSMPNVVPSMQPQALHARDVGPA